MNTAAFGWVEVAIGVVGMVLGQWFDAVTLDLEDPSLLPGPPTIGHLVYALSPTAIDAVFVSGRQLIAGGKPLSFDPKPLIDWARAQP